MARRRTKGEAALRRQGPSSTARFARIVRCAAAGWVVVAIATGWGCRALLRYPVDGTRPERSTDEILSESMNPFVLTDLVASRLAIEVDWVEGAEPSPMAIEALRETIHRYSTPNKVVEILLDDEVPRHEWDALADPSDTTPLVKAHLDLEPDPSASTEVVYVLYAPRLEDRFGFQTTWVFERDSRVLRVEGIVVLKELIRKKAILWITPDRVDRSTLVHEFGHVLGLVSNPEHEHRGNPHHCTNPGCVMAHPRLRSVLYNFVPALFAARIPRDYGPECREDIRRARRLWRERAGRDPDFPRRLLARREAARLEAESGLRWKGEAREAAILAMQQAIALEPDRAGRHAKLGFMLRATGRIDEALAAYREAIRLDPGGDVRWQAAQLLCSRGRYGEALALVEHRSAGSYWEQAMASRALLGLARPDAAIASWERYLAREDLSDEARQAGQLELARLNRRTGHLDRAERIVRRAKPAWKRQLSWELEAGRLAMARGDTAEAEGHLRAVLDVAVALLDDGEEGNDAWAMSTRAEILALLGDEAGARSALDGIDATDDPESETWTRLQQGRVLALLGDKDAALDALSGLVGEDLATWDPCLDENLDPIRDDPRFGDLFPFCPPEFEPAGGRRSG